MRRPKNQRGLWALIELTDGRTVEAVMDADLLKAQPWRGIEIHLRTKRCGQHHRQLCLLRHAIRNVEVIGVMGGAETRGHGWLQ